MTTQVGLSFGLEPEAPPKGWVQITSLPDLVEGLPATIAGKCVPDATVTVLVNGEAWGAAAASGGDWSVDGTPTAAMAGSSVTVSATTPVGDAGYGTTDVITSVATYIRGAGITVSGGAVQTWADNSGSNDVTQPLAPNRPTDNLTEVVFDGDDYLQDAGLGSVFGDGVTGLYLAFVIKASVDTGGLGIFEFGDFAGSNGELLIDINASDLRCYANGGYKAPFVAWPDVTAFHVLEAHLHDGVVDIYVDGTLGGSPSSGGSLDLDGLIFTLAARASSATAWDGDFRATVVRGATTSAERTIVYAALADFLL